MADIDVERKGAPIWPWILGLLALALLAWLLFSMLDDDDELDTAAVVTDTIADTMGVMPAAPVAGGPAAGGEVLDSFQQQCTGAQGEMAADHAFVARCLRQLADVADTVLTRPQAAGVEARGELEEVRRRAAELEESPADAGDHATVVSGAFTSAAALIERMQQGMGGAAADGERLRAEATAVQPGTPLLEQREAVHTFFRSAAQALQPMLMAPA
jgi:hypothetical protein